MIVDQIEASCNQVPQYVALALASPEAILLRQLLFDLTISPVDKISQQKRLK